MTDELHTISLMLEIEPAALTLLQRQADQQGLTLDQLAARYIGRAAAQAKTQAGHIRAANAFNGWVERNQPQKRPEVPAPVPAQEHFHALDRKAGEEHQQRAETPQRQKIVGANTRRAGGSLPSEHLSVADH